MWKPRKPSTELMKDQIEIDPAGYIIADESTRTNIPGVFAVGDVRTKACKQPLYKTFAVQGLQFCNRSSGRVYQMQSSSASFASCSRNAG